MENVNISCITDCDKCERIRRFFCEYCCAERADHISLEFLVNVSRKFLAERMVLLVMVFSNYENFLTGTEEKDKVEFAPKSHLLEGLSIINVDRDEEIAGYYKVLPEDGRFNVESWITDYCAADISQKGYLSDKKLNDKLKYRLVVMAY